MTAIRIEWHEMVYPQGRHYNESQPQFVAYMVCPAVNELDPAAEVVESLVGIGGFLLLRNQYMGDRQYGSWHPTVDEAYAAAYRWACRKSRAGKPEPEVGEFDYWPQRDEASWWRESVLRYAHRQLWHQIGEPAFSKKLPQRSIHVWPGQGVS